MENAEWLKQKNRTTGYCTTGKRHSDAREPTQQSNKAHYRLRIHVRRSTQQYGVDQSSIGRRNRTTKGAKRCNTNDNDNTSQKGPTDPTIHQIAPFLSPACPINKEASVDCWFLAKEVDFSRITCTFPPCCSGFATARLRWTQITLIDTIESCKGAPWRVISIVYLSV